MTESESEADAVRQVELTVYGSMVLLGVVAAAVAKGVADTPGILAFVILTGALSMIIAHAWAGVVAHRMVHKQRITRDLAIRELWFAGSVLVPAMATLIAILFTAAANDFDTTATAVQGTLLALLFAIGLVGARRTGAGWLGALAWACLDVAVGVGIVILKDLLIYLVH